MTIFARETIQQLLDDNYGTGVTTKEQTKRHVDNLNAGNEQSLSFEWEVVLLNVLSKVGTVIHEKAFGRKNPDVYFISRTEPTESFIGDIVTVSDEGHQAENPVNAFTLELERIVKKYGLNIYNFSVKIGDYKEPFRPHSKTKLKIPFPQNLHREFFNAEFRKFLRAIAANPNTPRPYGVKTDTLDIEVEYNPNQDGFEVSSTAYDVHPPQRQNPLLNALKGKAKKLKEAEYDGTRGVFLCDGGSTMFFFRRSDAVFSGSEEVIEDFLRQNSSVSFVLVTYVEILYDPYPNRTGYKVSTELYLNERGSGLSVKLRDTLNSLEQFFPTPAIDVRSSLSNIKRKVLRKADNKGSFTVPPNSREDDASVSTAYVEPVLRKWSNPIKRPSFRQYSMKIVTDVLITEEEKQEVAQVIAEGAEAVDREGNILAPPNLTRRVLESHPNISSQVKAGKVDILYDPLTFQVIAGFKANSTD
jgi:hypothetical protein